MAISGEIKPRTEGVVAHSMVHSDRNAMEKIQAVVQAMISSGRKDLKPQFVSEALQTPYDEFPLLAAQYVRIDKDR